MTIGAGIFLMAVGAILAFAVDVTVSGLNIAVVGVVLMIAGAVGIILDFAIFAPRRRRIAGERVSDLAAGPADEVYTEEEVPAQPVRRYRRRRVRTTTREY